MTYGQDLAGSARRHLTSGNLLNEDTHPGRTPGSKAVAGYLFGLAGELALKEIMRQSGMRPRDSTERRNDPFFAHFPNLKSLLRDHAKGIRSGILRRYAENSKLFLHWETSMRYSPTSEIGPSKTHSWKVHAEMLVADMDF
jgi:hypothetical protein